MLRRELHAVGFDGHGIVVEKDTQGGSPESVGRIGREFWARCYSEAAFMQGIRLEVDPIVLWEIRRKIELRTPRMTKGRPVRAKTWEEWVNYLILKEVLARRVRRETISVLALRKIARQVRKLHRRDMSEHIMYPDMRELVHWVKEGLGLGCFVHTGQEDERFLEQCRRCKVPLGCISHIFTTQRLRANKMTREFWEQVMAELGLRPWQMVVLDNNAVQGTFCVTVGIPALILDRDGVQGEFFRRHGPRLRGVPILDEPGQIPPRAPFVAFARSPQVIREWILAMNPARQLRLQGVR